MASDDKNQKTSFLDRAKKLGEKLFTKKNMAIAAPIVGAAAAMASKRVRDSVGEAVKSTGESIGLSRATKSPAKAKGANGTKVAASKKTAAAKSAKTAAKPKKASGEATPAAKRARKPAAKADSGATS